MSPLEISLVPALKDNYVFLLRDAAAEKAVVIDPSEAGPVIRALESKGWDLDEIWITHHHWDHTGGNLALKRHFGCTIIGAKADRHRIDGIDREVEEGDCVRLAEHVARVIEIPGHTTGHIAYFFEKEAALFCGDTLFSYGCGRAFEGTHAELWGSLQKLAALPDETQVYCAHEYTLANLKFLLSVEPRNQALQKEFKRIQALREQGTPSVPSLLSTEKKGNGFLVNDVKRFSDLRHRKDIYRTET